MEYLLKIISTIETCHLNLRRSFEEEKKSISAAFSYEIMLVFFGSISASDFRGGVGTQLLTLIGFLFLYRPFKHSYETKIATT